MPGDERDGAGGVSVRDGDPGVRRRRDTGADAGDDLEADPGFDERLSLFPAATEHERVSTLQPHDAPSCGSVLDQEPLDLGLVS